MKHLALNLDSLAFACTKYNYNAWQKELPACFCQVSGSVFQVECNQDMDPLALKLNYAHDL